MPHVRAARLAAYQNSPAPVSSYNVALDSLDSSNNSNAETSLNSLYLSNAEWAEEQAQKQMDFQTSANKIAMDFSSAEADKARAWEAEMANTAYQRAVKDLKAAGLNPILAYSQGGAAVPSVSAAQGVTSSGSMANMVDTGYTSYQLNYAKQKLALSTALDVAKLILSLEPNNPKNKIGF